MLKAATAALMTGVAAGVLNMDRALHFGSLTTIANCGSSADHAKNLQVTVSPETPVRGQNFTTTFDYDLDKEVTGGDAKYTVTLNGLPFSQTDSLCADQAGSADPCPLAVGHHHDISNTAFPDVSGKVVSKIQWTDQDGEPVLCVELTFRV